MEENGVIHMRQDCWVAPCSPPLSVWSLIPNKASLGLDGAGGFNRVKVEAGRLPVIWTWSDPPSV